MKIHAFLLTAIVAFGSLTSCKSIEEAEDLAKAQKCLDEVPQTSPQDASSCFQFVEKYTSQQANILKCSILHTSGGLVENKLVKAAEALISDAITNKEAAFMTVLTLDTPNITAGLSKAQQADVYCQDTGIPSLRYLSGLIVAGTAISKTMADLSLTTINVNDPPATINTAINDLLVQCAPAGSSPNGTCEGNFQAIGTAVQSLSSAYCNNEEAADSEICQDINSAVQAAGGNLANVGQAALCYMNKKTYDPVLDRCQ